jgi:hypothetical protein
MTSHLDTIMITVALAGTGAYMAYMIEKRRKDIRMTIQVIELNDTDFWEGLTRYRHLVPAKA